MSKLLSIYCEVIEIDGCFRVCITDSTNDEIHMFLSKFSDYESAEKYAEKMNNLLARFGGEYRQISLVPSIN